MGTLDSLIDAAILGELDFDPTVQAVQKAIMALPQYATDPLLNLGKGKADGKLGNDTKRAVARFNEAYRPDAVANDGENITDGTLAALHVSRAGASASAGKATAPAARPATSSSAVAPPVAVTVAKHLATIPTWQYAVAGVGLAAVGFGLYKALKR